MSIRTLTFEDYMIHGSKIFHRSAGSDPMITTKTYFEFKTPKTTFFAPICLSKRERKKNKNRKRNSNSKNKN